jgi:hypothetical protein
MPGGFRSFGAVLRWMLRPAAAHALMAITLFGVYNAAAGRNLSDTLDLANTYGKYFSHYAPDSKRPMDQTYKAIPADNVANIKSGYNDYTVRGLCQPK